MLILAGGLLRLMRTDARAMWCYASLAGGGVLHLIQDPGDESQQM
jgi:hypothetical protein